MSPLTCPEVEARLDLYAADECDAAEAEAVRRHLAHCPRCATAFAEARQLMGLLDLRWQEPERLRRLEEHITAEEAPRRRVLRFPTGLRHVASLAAMLLLTVGLTGWLSPLLGPGDGDGGLVVALREGIARGGVDAQFVPAAAVRGGPKEMARPSVGLTLELRNPTERTIRVWVDGPQTELRLDVSGPGVESRPVKDGGRPPSEVTLRPGEQHVIRSDRLTDSRREWYWTKPGEHTVTARFTTRATIPGVGERRITVHSDPITIPADGP
jgi:hypothetical protein